MTFFVIMQRFPKRFVNLKILTLAVDKLLTRVSLCTHFVFIIKCLWTSWIMDMYYKRLLLCSVHCASLFLFIELMQQLSWNTLNILYIFKGACSKLSDLENEYFLHTDRCGEKRQIISFASNLKKKPQCLCYLLFYK